MAIWCTVLFVPGALLVFGWVATEFAYGAALIPGGLIAWLVIRVAFFSVKGSETGIVVLDEHGTVRVYSGQFAVRRFQHMFTKGSARWFGRGFVNGLLFFLAGMALLVAPAFVVGKFVMIVFLVGAAWAILDMTRWLWMLVGIPWFTKKELLDSSVVLPMLAIHARHHGWRPTIGGVSADQLRVTLTANPDDVRTAEMYSKLSHAATRWLSKMHGY